MSEFSVKRTHTGAWQVEAIHPGLSRSKIFTGTDFIRVERTATEQGAAWDNEWDAVRRSEEAKNASDEMRFFLSSSLSMPHSLDWEYLKDSTPFAQKEPARASLPEIPPEPELDDPQFVTAVYSIKAQLADQIINAVLAELPPREPHPTLAEITPKRWDTNLEPVPKQRGRARLMDFFFRRAAPSEPMSLEAAPLVAVTLEPAPLAVSLDAPTEPPRPLELVATPPLMQLALSRRHRDIPESVRQYVEQRIVTRYLLAIEEEQAKLLALARAEWQDRKRKIEEAIDLVCSDYKERFSAWEQRRREFQNEQERQHVAINALRSQYLDGDTSAISEAIRRVVARWPYPAWLLREHGISFNGDTGIIIVDERLPTLSDIPALKEVRYIKAKNEFTEVAFPVIEIRQLYDDFAYQIFLHTVYLIYKFDAESHIKSVVFNGWVEFVDPTTGHDTKCCIMSAHVERDAFLSLNLLRVDPRACFRALKGIGSPNLHTMTPVAPLMRTNAKDSRFVESRDVADQLREGTNVAAIGWEDFEHLIREIFQKELSQSGAEVKVTRASRDGGVDAIAFDPDPIRGGKIVIQAKRYTNTVDVSAVRDLYGTVTHEGATKGILVTTSNFGPDAYSFAKDKPITLLDGSNLLHLLERHGHRAYIDLAEAKKLNPTPLARTFSKDG